jgi:hypothetical protein
LNQKDVRSNETIENLKNSLENENLQLKSDLIKIRNEWQLKYDQLMEQQTEDNQNISKLLQKEYETKMNNLKRDHHEDMKGQTIAHKIALTTMKQTAENNLLLQLDIQQQKFIKEKDMLKYELDEKFFTQIDRLRDEHSIEIATIHKELESANDSNKQKERQMAIKVDDLQTQLQMKQKNIDKLNSELKNNREYIEELRDCIQIKTNELTKMHHQIEKEIERVEIEMDIKRTDDIKRINADHLRQKQLLVDDFKNSHELLKEKIIESEETYVDLNSNFLLI